MDPLRHFRRTITQFQQYPPRRFRAGRRPSFTLEEHSVGPIEVEPSGLDGRIDHGDLMLVVGVVVALLALGLLVALTALLLSWF